MGNRKNLLTDSLSEDEQELEEEEEELPSSENEYESESESEPESEELEIERELADIPFEELQRARADGSHVSDSFKDKTLLKQKPSRANKNRPMEISSKVRPKKFREIIQAPKKVVRDPRFESLCGTLDADGFKKRYNFLFEVQLPAEKEKLQKLIAKSKDPNAVAELKNHISWIDKQMKSGWSKSAESQILSEHVKKEKEAAKHGKRPYYLKQSEIRKKKLMEKYNELKGEGKLDSFIEKRRRKNASKDHRYMPYRRPNSGAN